MTPSIVENGKSQNALAGENASSPANARSSTVWLSVPRQLASAAAVIG